MKVNNAYDALLRRIHEWHSKVRIIPFYRQETIDSPTNQCKILSFKYHNGHLTNPRLAAGNTETVKNPGDCKLDFIWDHLL